MQCSKTSQGPRFEIKEIRSLAVGIESFWFGQRIRWPRAFGQAALGGEEGRKSKENIDRGGEENFDEDTKGRRRAEWMWDLDKCSIDRSEKRSSLRGEIRDWKSGKEGPILLLIRSSRAAHSKREQTRLFLMEASLEIKQIQQEMTECRERNRVKAVIVNDTPR